MRNLMTTIGVVWLLVYSPAPMADDWQYHGDLGFESRYFGHDSQWQDQSDGLQASIRLNLESRWRNEDGSQRASFEPFLRLDSTDSERSHFDLRQAYWAIEGDGWEVLVGFNKVFWGVTESRHLVDVINQTDLVEDLDQEQKLGQPMIRGLLERDWGQLELYVMPWFRERTFAGEDGRLRTPLPVDADHAVYESSAGQHHTDLALRWSHYIDDVDIGVYGFHGTGREPVFEVSPDGSSLRPYYHQVSQLGLDIQYTREAWLWKFEAIARDGLEDRFFATVAGFEYTFYGIRNGALDIGLLVEYLYDGRAPTEPQTAFDDDIFIGSRLALNDTQDTSVLAGVVLDSNESEWFFNLEAERRIGENIFAEARIRLFNGDPELHQLSTLDRDDHVQLSLSRYF